MAGDQGLFRSIGKAAAKKLSDRLAQAAGKPATEGETEAVQRTRAKLEKFLTQGGGGIETDSRGLLTFPYESTRVFLGVAPLTERHSVIDIHAVTNFEVPASDELRRFLLEASSQAAFGHVEVAEKDGKALVVFAHRIMGDFLQEDELQSAISCVALTADKLDDEIQQRFGGKRFKDLVADRSEGSSEPPAGDDVREQYDHAGYL